MTRPGIMGTHTCCIAMDHNQLYKTHNTYTSNNKMDTMQTDI